MPALPHSSQNPIRSFVTAAHPLVAAIALATLAVFPASRAAAAIHSHAAPVKLDPNVPVPAITFDQTRCDFGQIAAGQKVAHAFTVTNTGQALLRIEQPHASCGCTSATIGQQELKPGESTQIVAIYTAPEGFTGAMRKSVLVVSNDPNHSKLTLRLAGDVLPAGKSAAASDAAQPIAKASATAPAAAAAKPQISK